MDSVNYLGFILSQDGLKMDPCKVQAITDWPEPRKVKDIQSFLGFLQTSIDVSFLIIPLLSSLLGDKQVSLVLGLVVYGLHLLYIAQHYRLHYLQFPVPLCVSKYLHPL